MPRHELDLTSLLAGMLFIGLGLAFVLELTEVVDVDARWIWPVLFLGLGAAGLASSLRTVSQRDDTQRP